MREQQLDDLSAAVCDREHQGAAVVGVTRVDIGSPIQQELQLRNIALFGGTPHCRSDEGRIGRFVEDIGFVSRNVASHDTGG